MPQAVLVEMVVLVGQAAAAAAYRVAVPDW